MESKEQVHPLFKIKFGIIPIANYRGCLVEKLIGGWKVFNQKYLTPQEVDKAIDDNCNTIDKSILKV